MKKSSLKIGIIVAQFNKSITDKLLAGAKQGLEGKKVDFDIIEVPGAFEIPLAALRMAKSKKYSALIALGVVIKGETDHYEMICRACVDGIREVMLKYEIPIAFEVLMVQNAFLAEKRAVLNKHSNKGYIAAKVALNLYNNLNKYENG